MKNNLIVSETFYSIQGEGQTMGVPSVFLRLGGCNLLCKGDGWICDSIKVWKKGKSTPFNKVIPEFIEKLRNGAHLVITGGEPLLHREQIGKFLIWFQSEYDFKPIIEVETNGTFSPTPLLESLVDYWNVSPKLKNSGESKIKRINSLALVRLNMQENVIFKFVINEEDDFVEILQDFGDLIEISNCVLMPAGENQEQLEKTRLIVAELCVRMGIRYSDRLHIVIWNKKTGV
jgi:7-carboxy-7-deazaguanine synthase